VLTPPEALAEDTLVTTLAGGWGVSVSAVAYRPVGFGSHHWEVVDTGGTRWFATVDDLETRRRSVGEPLDRAYDRLRAALATAREVHGHGYRFPVAPVATRAGESVVRIGHRYALALYPFVDGQSFSWGADLPATQRRAVLDLVIALHTAPKAVRRHAMTEDFAVPHRDEVEAALDSPDTVGDRGPYGRATALLLAEHAAPVRRLLARYDALVREGVGQPSRTVLTHGEPHPGNTMLTADGWRLIDWDTALVAPPERDLWMLDSGDGSGLADYATATGVPPLPSMLELYRLRWDVADLAAFVAQFRRPHAGSADDDKSWQCLRALVGQRSSAG
jgi:aminoglycoside phosphotransferase (APT) family kinase protein